ncbi:response regulator transcription factor [Dactylosporangium roseum]|uniref:Response regulator transcription factor n=1 Tax=Dactylosporangium roseum TaxID=47989 RepID=A0ABY5Z9A0_9ACTN|nr:response regulator transcription factor [Dactylosporangium roseum]UWZ38660.1 response regulator transcription factor [Dactylosporangium roseum]
MDQDPEDVVPDELPEPEAGTFPVATVLLAEDDPDIRDLFTMVMEGAGIAVTAVSDGQQALEALHGAGGTGDDPGFDLLVTDMWMPKLSGLDLCRRLRADPATQGLPVLMLSAYGRLRGREEAMMVGATEYVQKPVRPSQFISKVDSLLGGRLVTRGS